MSATDDTWPGNTRGELRIAREIERRRRRRRRLRLALVSVLALGFVGGAAVALTGAVDLGGDGSRAAAERADTPSVGIDPVIVETTECRSPLTPEDPLRLWIGGDSLAGSLGPALGTRAAATGVVAPVFDSRVSSGLASPEFFDWPEHATEELARLDPEVVVFIIGANDWNVPRATPTDDAGEPAWEALYASAVEEMLDVLNGDQDERPVYWVGSPPMQERGEDGGVREVNRVAQEVIAQHQEAAYIDNYALFADDAGMYTATLATGDDGTVRVRAADGVHYTEAGGEYLGRAVFESIDARCRIEEQAVEDADQRVVQAPGSERLPGGGGGGGGGTPGTGSTPVTSPPTQPPTSPPTQPPTTQPPPPTTLISLPLS